MFIVDVPSLPSHVAPLMTSVSQNPRPDAPWVIRTVGFCRIVPNGPDHDPNSAESVFEPILSMQIYFRIREHRELKGPGTVVVSHAPKHGLLNDEGEGAYRYLPNDGYFGPDQATVLVEMDGVRIKLVFFFQSIQAGAIGNTTYADLCGKKALGWRLPTRSQRSSRVTGK